MAVKALMTDETGKQIVDAIREKAGLEERVSDLEKNKVDKSSIAQTPGDAEDKVMSQKTATEELEKKFDKSNVVQSTGDAEDKVMSQAASTVEFTKLSEEIVNESENRQNAISQERNRAVARENEIEALFTAPTQEAVNKWLDEHPEATTTVLDGSLTTDKLVVGTLGYVTPEMFGAKGDGVTDDTEAIQKAVNSGFVVYFDPHKCYGITSTIHLVSNSVIDLCCTTIKNISTSPLIMIKIEDVENVVIKNGYIKNVWLQGHESGDFIIEISSSRHITIDNLKLSECISDGVYIGYTYWYAGKDVYRTSNITIKNCTITVGRNGISLVSGDGVIIDGNVFHDITNNAPKAGIDIEPETGTNHHLHLNNIHITNNIFKNCTGGLTTYLEKVKENGDIHITNNTFDNSILGIDGSSSDYAMVIDVNGCSFINNMLYAINIGNNHIKQALSVKNITIHGTTFDNDDPVYFGAICIFSTRNDNGNISIDGVTFTKDEHNKDFRTALTIQCDNNESFALSNFNITNFVVPSYIRSDFYIHSEALSNQCNLDIEKTGDYPNYYLQSLNSTTRARFEELTSYDTDLTLATFTNGKKFTLYIGNAPQIRLTLPQGYTFKVNGKDTVITRGGNNIYFEYMVFGKTVIFTQGNENLYLEE